MEIANISMWKNLQSEPQRTAAAPRSKKLFVDALAHSTLRKFRGKLLQSAS